MQRRWPQITIVLLTFLIGVLTNVATSTLPASWEPYLWLAWVPLIVCVAVVIWLELREQPNDANSIEQRGDTINVGNLSGTGPIAIGRGARASTSITVVNPLRTAQQRLNRSRMIDKVELFWVKGVLEQSLYQMARVELGLKYAPDKVDHPWRAVVQEVGKGERVLQPGQRTIDVFDSLGGELLILGASGAGKTTLLLELARDLIARARGNEEYPIPVVFNLSTWAIKRAPLGEWLVEELNQRYDVPKKVAHEWVVANAILPLLDGLDEVAVQHRADCVKAINAYRQQESFTLLAVCSRVLDYEALSINLRLAGAVAIQLLDRGQVENYLKQVGRPLAAVKAALKDDPTLWELLDNPLMLSIVGLAYKDKSPARLRAAGKPEERRGQLFDDYIAAMFQRRGKEMRYSQKQTTGWLSWLAGQMVEHQETVFYIEKMQPIWIPVMAQRRFDRQIGLLRGLIIGFVTGVIVGSMCIFLLAIFWPGVWSNIGLSGVLMSGLIAGVLFGVAFGVLGFRAAHRGDTENIDLVEKIIWSARPHPTLLATVISIGLLAGVVYGLAYGSGTGIIVGLTATLALILPVLTLNLTWRDEPDEVRVEPNQGIWRSTRNALGLSLGTGFSIALAVGLALGLVNGYAFGVAFGLPLGIGVSGFLALFFGAEAFLKHFLLRANLYFADNLPWNLARFLDYCAERIFLRKVGGGYIFVHRLLMEHFAALNLQQPTVEANETKKTTT